MPILAMSPHLRIDLDRWLLPWAEQFGWTVVDTNPPVFTKAGRTLQLQYNSAGRCNKMLWIGGNEHSATISGTTSMNKVREWMATELVVAQDDDLILP